MSGTFTTPLGRNVAVQRGRAIVPQQSSADSNIICVGLLQNIDRRLLLCDPLMMVTAAAANRFSRHSPYQQQQQQQQ